MPGNASSKSTSMGPRPTLSGNRYYEPPINNLGNFVHIARQSGSLADWLFRERSVGGSGRHGRYRDRWRRVSYSLNKAAYDRAVRLRRSLLLAFLWSFLTHCGLLVIGADQKYSRLQRLLQQIRAAALRAW